MSDSEDDFMSDKFLVEASAPKQQTYTQRREAERLKSLRKGQAKNMPSMAQLEKERRAEGLNRSLFDDAGPSRPTDTSASGGALTSGSSSRTAGGNKAMEMMMKMGWKVGEGLGKRSPSPPAGSSKRARLDDGNEDEEEGAARGGIGSKSLGTRGRAEPIRVSLWAGRKGLTARSPSPPPLRTSSNRNPDALDPAKLAMLGDRANDFRAVQRLQFALKETEKKEWQARDMLVQLDDEQGIRYHPLHAMRSNPLKTLPKPLKRLIYPVEVVSESPDSEPTELPDAQPIIGPIMPDMPTAQPTGTETKHERYISEAEKTRERMRRDMLSAIPTEEEQTIQARKRALGLDGEGEGEKAEEDKKRYQKTVWAEMVSGTKKVLAMGAETHLRFLLSQLRNEHMYCLWCSTKYSSFEEMDGPGGCPGEDEDDH